MAEKLRKRCEIDDKYKWKLTDIFPSDEAWEQALSALAEKVKAFAAHDGHVAENPRQVIREYFILNEEVAPVYMYAMLKQEADNADPTAQVQLSAACSFLEPELLAMDEQTLTGMMNDPDMRDYSEYLRQLLRQKPHTLPKEQERLLAMMEESGDLESLIALEQRLSEVAYEIESYQRDLNNWDRRVAYSTVSIDLWEVSVYTPTVPVTRTFGEKLGDAFSDGWRGFVRGLQNLVLLLAELLPNLVLLSVIVLAVVFGIRTIRKRRAAKRAKKATKPDQKDGE